MCSSDLHTEEEGIAWNHLLAELHVVELHEVSAPALRLFQIGSNDIRKVEETLTSHLYILNIADNPNISIDVTSVCPYIKAGMYKLFYDKNQDIRGCDALDLEN